MTDVSKLARARLAQAPLAGAHPEADQLAALAERALTGAEREQVLAHLATCADCREVLALAAPDNTEELAGAPARPKWLPWPVMRWGAVAAAVAVVAVAVVMQSPQRSPVATMHKAAPQQPEDRAFVLAGGERRDAAKEMKAEPSAPARPVTEPPTTATLNKKSAPKDEEKLARAGAGSLARKREADKLAGGKAADGRTATGSVGESASAQMADAAAARSESTIARDQASSRNAMEVRQAAAPSPAAAPVQAEEAQLASSATEPGKAKRSSQAAASATPAYVGADTKAHADYGLAARLQPATYRWTIGAEGQVQRSPDGRTWRDVPIAKDVKFRALANSGNDVWAGGTNTSLFHSADAGATWKRVALAGVQGDVIRLALGPHSLAITTSAGQTMEISHPGLGADDGKQPPSPR